MIKYLLFATISMNIHAVNSDLVVSLTNLVRGQKSALEKFNAELRLHPLVVVKCTKNNCPPCKVFAPKFSTIAKEFQGKAHFMELEVERFQALVAPYKVKRVPMVLIFSQGKLTHTLFDGKLQNLTSLLTQLTSPITLK